MRAPCYSERKHERADTDDNGPDERANPAPQRRGRTLQQRLDARAATGDAASEPFPSLKIDFGGAGSAATPSGAGFGGPITMIDDGGAAAAAVPAPGGPRPDAHEPDRTRARC